MNKVLISLIAFLSVAINAFGVSTNEEYGAMVEAATPYTNMLQGKGVAKDIPTALSKLNELAESGNTYAAAYLGFAYAGNLGVEKNLEEAEKWYRIGAEDEIVWAMANFADFLWFKDDIECMKWYRKCAVANQEKYGYWPINAARKILGLGWAKTDDERADLVIDLIDGVFINKNVGALIDLFVMDIPGLEDNEKLKNKYAELYEGAYQGNDKYQEVGVAWMQSKGLGVKKDLDKAMQTYLVSDVGYIPYIAGAVIYEEKNDVASAKRFYNQAIQHGYKKGEWLEKRLKALEEKSELAN